VTADSAPVRQSERHEILYRLMLVASFVGQDFSTRFGRHRVTLPEWRVLLELHREGADSAAAIARRTGLSAMGVSRAVATLLEAGRILRTPDPSDGRRQSLALSPRGRQLVARILPDGEAVAALLLTRVPDADRPALAAMLDAMLAAAREGPWEGA